MWIDTDKELINLEYVARVVVTKNFLNFYRQETPATGDSAKDVHRDTLSQIKYQTEEEAKAAYGNLKELLKASLSPFSE